jgi:hypothetical protein
MPALVIMLVYLSHRFSDGVNNKVQCRYETGLHNTVVYSKKKTATEAPSIGIRSHQNATAFVHISANQFEPRSSATPSGWCHAGDVCVVCVMYEQVRPS